MKKIVTILPLKNLSDNIDDSYLCEGFRDEIANGISKLSQFKVVSSRSLNSLNISTLSAKEIGEKFNSTIIVLGTFRRVDNRIRVGVEIVDIDGDCTLLSERFEGVVEELFDLEDRVAIGIVDQMREEFGHFEIDERLIPKKTDHFTAYEYYLKGRYHKNRWSIEECKKGIELFTKGLQVDNRFGDLYLGIADCYSFLATTGDIPFEKGWKLTTQYLEQGRKYGGDRSLIYYLQSNLSFFIDCDYQKSFKYMVKSVDDNPNNGEAHQFLSFLYIISGRKEQSHFHLEQSTLINPFLDENRFYRAYFLYMIGENRTALLILDEIIESNNENIPALSVKMSVLLKLGRYNEVINFCEDSTLFIEEERIGLLTIAYILKKDIKQSSKYFERLAGLMRSDSGITAEGYYFISLALLKRFDQLFEWVADSFNKRSPLLLFRFTDPLVENLRCDERYGDYHQKIYGKLITGERGSRRKDLISKDELDYYHQRVIQYLEKEKPFLNPDLTLRDLAKGVDLSPNQLSWLLNEVIGKNFTYLVNSFRLNRFLEIGKDPKWEHLSILGKAFESGFSSKTVFNNFFRKVKGVTPKEYLNKIESGEN